MELKTTKSFQNLKDKLPLLARNKAEKAYILWKRDQEHPGLEFKKIVVKSGVMYSVRIDIKYRALGKLNQDTIIWFWIGSHAEYDLLINRLYVLYFRIFYFLFQAFPIAF